jgi:hypothetical protein
LFSCTEHVGIQIIASYLEQRIIDKNVGK